MEHTKKSIHIKKDDMFKIASYVLLGLLVISVLTEGFRFHKIISKEEASAKAISYINENLLPAGMAASLVSVERDGKFYNIGMDIAGQAYESYITTDGKMLFPTGINLPDQADALDDVTGDVCAGMEKTSEPTIELFVMSQCPFGSVAIKAMAPVFRLMKDIVNMNIYFIAKDNGDGTFTSLHGQPEVDEDIREVCAIEKYPDTYFDYLECVAEDYSNAETIWEDCAEESGMNVEAIRKCYTGTEGKELFSENIRVASELGIGRSPTLLVNGESYSGQRTPDLYKNFICCAFGAEMEECNEVLGSGSGSTTTGSC